jgi:hypothetical protein
MASWSIARFGPGVRSIQEKQNNNRRKGRRKGDALDASISQHAMKMKREDEKGTQFFPRFLAKDYPKKVASNRTALYFPLPEPLDDELVGQWTIKFPNGVVETCQIHKDGTANVAEPKRNSGGKIEVKNGVLILVFNDDRTERWKKDGAKMIVEHWNPSSQFHLGQCALGYAEKSKD